jgi:hypothetical protein
MKTYTKFSDVPARASYLGSEHGDGSMDENLADAIDAAFEPACYRDADKVRHYFDLFQN